MGSFVGHILPGTFFLMFGCRWTLIVLINYYKTFRRKGSFRCDAIQPSSCCPSRPVEGYVKIISCTIGIIGETVTALDENYNFVHLGNAQHITMFFFFGLNGVIDVLLASNFPLPPGSDYLSMAMACGVEGLLFYFHLHGRPPLDVHIHTLLIVAIFLSFVACLAESANRSNVLSILFRSFCTILQGTWFYQIGFVLYNPLPGSVKWDEHNHMQMMLITAIFCWHAAAIVICMGAVGLICWLRYRPIYVKNRDFFQPDDMSTDTPLIKTNSTRKLHHQSHKNGQIPNKDVVIANGDDDDYDDQL